MFGDVYSVIPFHVGTGQVATVLADKFEHVYGVDISATMLASAVQKPNITYRVSKSEDLSWIPDSSIDAVTVAEAIHWFDLPKFFAEVKRILKPKGTFAALSYSIMRLSDYPQGTKRIREFCSDPDQLGKCWENGTKMVGTMLRSVEVPLKNVERHYFPDHPDGLPPLMGDTVSIAHIRNHLRTWSAYKIYCDRYPDREDLVERTIEDIKHADNPEKFTSWHYPAVDRT